MVCVGLLTAIRTAALRGCGVVGCGLAFGIAGLELVDVSGEWDWVSAPGVAALGAGELGDWDWVSAPGVAVRGL